MSDGDRTCLKANRFFYAVPFISQFLKRGRFGELNGCRQFNILLSFTIIEAMAGNKIGGSWAPSQQLKQVPERNLSQNCGYASAQRPNKETHKPACLCGCLVYLPCMGPSTTELLSARKQRLGELSPCLRSYTTHRQLGRMHTCVCCNYTPAGAIRDRKTRQAWL